MLFLKRREAENGAIPKHGSIVWYGHVHNLGECVLEEELGEEVSRDEFFKNDDE